MDQKSTPLGAPLQVGAYNTYHYIIYYAYISIPNYNNIIIFSSNYTGGICCGQARAVQQT